MRVAESGLQRMDWKMFVEGACARRRSEDDGDDGDDGDRRQSVSQ